MHKFVLANGCNRTHPWLYTWSQGWVLLYGCNECQTSKNFLILKLPIFSRVHYSLRPKLWTKCCFMKQKCQLQMGIVKCKNAATPLSTLGINTKHQHFQMRYITFFWLKGLKSYQLSKFECADFISKIDFTFILW